MEPSDTKMRDTDTGADFSAHLNAPDLPELYEGMVSRRVFAFLIDVTLIALISSAVFMVTLALGIFTFGLAWLALGLVFPGVALLYTAFGVSGPRSATFGMRVMDIQLRLRNGDRLDFLMAIFHAVGFYVSLVALTPFVLAIALFEPRGRLVHDLLLGTIMVDRQVAQRIF